MRRLAAITVLMLLAASAALILMLHAQSSRNAMQAISALPDSRAPRHSQGKKTRSAAPQSRGSASFSSTQDSASEEEDDEDSESWELGQSPQSRAQHIADISHLFPNEPDPGERCRLAAELGEINDPEALKQLLGLLEKEQDPDVRQALLRALGSSPDRLEMAQEIARALSSLYQSSEDLELRTQVEDVFGEIASSVSTDFLRKIYGDKQADPQERLNAAENLMRLRTQDQQLIPPEEARQINDQLRLEAQAADNPAIRSQAIMALAERREENLEFFRQMLASETDPNVRNLLMKLTS